MRSSSRQAVAEWNRSHFAQEAAASFNYIHKRKRAAGPVHFWTDAGPERVAQSSAGEEKKTKHKKKKKQACGSPQRCLLTGGQCCGNVTGRDSLGFSAFPRVTRSGGSCLSLAERQHPCASTSRCTVSSHGRRSARVPSGDSNASSNAGFSRPRGWAPGDALRITRSETSLCLR